MSGRTCAGCGAEMRRRYREGQARFSRRQCCSLRCAGLVRARRERVPAEQMTARYRRVRVLGREQGEHRYVVEQAIGRPLDRAEQVHHRNEDRYDNRPENLEVVTPTEHGRRHTWRPLVKSCVICTAVFTPHKTKRARQQSCGQLTCKRALLSLRARQRYGRTA